MSAKTYSLKAVQCILGGFSIGGGYAEDNALEFEWDADLFEATTGGDGETAYSRMGNDNLTVTISVMESSKAYRDLAGLMQAQLFLVDTAVGPIVPLNFSLFDPRNGDTISAQYAVFMRRPAPSKGATVGEREFVINLNSPKVRLFGILNVA